ncbi:hypothetical protein TWF281_005333 [Arthrobotrys megalospora]
MAARDPITLPNIPDDVLRLIFRRNVSSKDLKSLRLAHRGFHGSVDPLLFENAIIAAPIHLDQLLLNYSLITLNEIWSRDIRSFPRPQDPSPETSLYQRSCILKRQVPRVLSDNVQSIAVRRYEVFEGYPDDGKMKKSYPKYSENGIKCLGHFLCSMKKLRSLTWSIPFSNISQLVDLSPIAGRLTTLRLTSPIYGGQVLECSHRAFRDFTSLTSLDFYFYGAAEIIDLNRLPHLRNLKYNIQRKIRPRGDAATFGAPQGIDFADFLAAQKLPFSLQTLSLAGHCTQVPIPHDLVNTFLASLQTLHLHSITPETESYPIIGALQENDIKIHHLNIQGCHPEIEDYLRSYTNTLQSLEIYVQCAKDAEGFNYDEEDAWAYSGRRLRWQEELIESKKQAFKSNVWKSIVAAHTNSIEHLTFAENFHLFYGDAEILSQCKALKTINMKGDDEVFKNLVPAATKLPALESVEFEIPWTPRKPNMSGWCGTAQLDWHMRPKDTESRLKRMHWREEDIDVNGTWRNVSFRVLGVNTDLKIVRNRDKFYPWILVGDGDMGIEGREGYTESDDEDDDESGDEDF